MSSTGPSQPASDPAAKQMLPEIDVWNWPLIDSGWRGVAIAGGTVAVGVHAGRVSDSGLMGSLACLSIMLSMWRFWLPVRYRCLHLGIEQVCLGRKRLIPWTAVEQCRLLRRGVVLRFRNKDLLFDGFAAKYVDGRGQRDRLVKAINLFRQTIPDDASSRSTAPTIAPPRK